ncbi:MAG: hypothetical protein SPL02_03085 [Bacilli bacterium]|nr:hypothetical protein [Bacilli bacterium]MDY6430882.1 hypothetical protein [Bacilli bacterium]
MQISFVIATTCLSVLSLVVLIFVGKILFKKELNEHFSLLARMPFELLQVKERALIFTLVGVFLAANIGVASIFVWLQIVMGSSMPSLVFGGFVLLNISLLGIFLTNFFNYRLHFLALMIHIFIAIIVGTILGSFYLGLRGFGTNLSYIFAIVSYIFAGVYVLLLLNPKFSSWSKLDKVAQNGAVSYMRPRVYVVAYTEWLIIFLNLGFVVFAAISYFLLYQAI